MIHYTKVTANSSLPYKSVASNQYIQMINRIDLLQIVMIAIFISFDAIQIAYTDAVNHQQHLVLQQKSPGVFTVIRQGIKIRNLLEHIAEIKHHSMSEDQDYLATPVCICLSAKDKKYSQPIFQVLSPEFEKHLLYFKINPNLYKQLPFNRATLEGNQICYGEGFAQLRPKQEMRLALSSLISSAAKKEFIFVETNPIQLKQLKKEGFLNIREDFNIESFNNLYQKIQAQTTVMSVQPQIEPIRQLIEKYPFAKDYLIKQLSTHKIACASKIHPFDTKMLTIKGLFSQLYKPTTYFNISPKSWVPHETSKQISSYIFHNLSDHRLYLSKTAKTKQLSNEEDYDKKILAYFLTYFINPNAFVLPHDKNISLIKFSKIKSYQSKKAYLNVRPYIQNLKTLAELGINRDDLKSIFVDGKLKGQQVKGLGGVLLMSLILNESFRVKGLCNQISFLSLNQMDGQIHFLDQHTLKDWNSLEVCKIDLFDILDSENYKLIDNQIILLNTPDKVTLTLQQLHPHYIKQMSELIHNISHQRGSFIRSLFNYYRWNTKLHYFYDIVQFRLEAIRQIINNFHFVSLPRQSLLMNYSELACLLTQQNYDYFMVPSKRIYSPNEFNFNSFISPQSFSNYEQQQTSQNPYLVYLNKTCGFAIYHISFPVHTFLQWVKSTNKFQIIQYMSMINHSFQDYLIMDKRMKLVSQNQKKSAILIVDHAELCENLVNKPKSIKTVIIFRLKKASEIQNIGIITEDTEKGDNLQDCKDEIIKILWSQGIKQIGADKLFQLHEWILVSYIKLKCSLYDLNFTTALQFLHTLHKSISTNRHRLKQLQQTHPAFYNYLYLFPIFKQNQKILLNYRLFQFLHAKYLFQSILNDRWNCRLQTHQNSSVIYCQKLINGQFGERLMQKLIKLLQQLDCSSQQMDYQYKKNDILQLIRSITQTTNKQLEFQTPYSMYFQVFAKLVKISNFNNIKQIVRNPQHLAVLDEETISIFGGNKQNHQIRLGNCDNQRILAITIKQNQIYLMVLASEGETYIRKLSISLVNRIKISNPVLEDYIQLNKRQNGFHQIKFFLHHNYVCCILVCPCKLTILYINPNQERETIIKQFKFDQSIKLVQLLAKHQYILCVTSKHITRICLQLQALTQCPQNVADINGLINDHTKCLVQLQNNETTTVLIYEKQIAYCYCLKANGDYSHKLRFQFPKNIKTLTVNKNNQLFVFFEGSDTLHLYHFNTTALSKLWSYYWVDINCDRIYAFNDTLYLQGGSHYVKCLELRNLISKAYLSSQ